MYAQGWFVLVETTARIRLCLSFFFPSQKHEKEKPGEASLLITFVSPPTACYITVYPHHNSFLYARWWLTTKSWMHLHAVLILIVLVISLSMGISLEK